MKNDYDNLQEFIISVIDGFIMNWSSGDSYNSIGLNLLNTYDISKGQVKVDLLSYKENELQISIEDKQDNKLTINVNIDKIPKLMSYLANKQNTYEFQRGWMTRFSENEFNEWTLITDEILLKGSLGEKPVIQNEKYKESYDLKINENTSMSFWIQPINKYKLGCVKVVTHMKRIGEGEIGFNRIIPIEQIEKFPFLKSIIEIPNFSNKDVYPDISKFISYFSNSTCDYVSPLAKNFDLRFQLQDELEPKFNEAKKLKI